MVDKEGRFVPSGHCTAQADWARSLHALGIELSDKVLSWKSPRVNFAVFIESTSSAPGLDVDGEVLCRSLNLLGKKQINTDRRPEIIHGTVVPISTDPGFARIICDTSSQPYSIRFRLGSGESIAAPRGLFGFIGIFMERGTLITKHYFNTMDQSDGCSDAEYGWPDPRIPLEGRIQDLYLIFSNWTRCQRAEFPQSTIKLRSNLSGTQQDSFQTMLDTSEDLLAGDSQYS